MSDPVFELKRYMRQLIETEIGSYGEVVIGGGFDPMSVRTCLTFFIYAAALVLNER